MRQNFSGFCMEEFPQYKAYNNGLGNLTIVELISLVIGTGTQKNVEQVRQIFNVMEESLRNIAKARVEDLQVVQGIGDSKAIALQAAIELGKRYSLEDMAERPDLGSSLAIYNFLYPHVKDLEVAECHLLLMNQNFRLIKHVPMSHGGITETAVDVRRIMREAVLNNATILAIAHNHPSNSLHSSKADDMLTKSVKEACSIMRIFSTDEGMICCCLESMEVGQKVSLGKRMALSSTPKDFQVAFRKIERVYQHACQVDTLEAWGKFQRV